MSQKSYHELEPFVTAISFRLKCPLSSSPPLPPYPLSLSVFRRRARCIPILHPNDIADCDSLHSEQGFSRVLLIRRGLAWVYLLVQNGQKEDRDPAFDSESASGFVALLDSRSRPSRDRMNVIEM